MLIERKTVGLVLFMTCLLSGGSRAIAEPVSKLAITDRVQQSSECKGVVRDASGETIIGASVVVKGTSNGAITDMDGVFSLKNVPQGSVVVVSFVGYQTQEVKWMGMPLTITLADDSKALDEVVVVGYGVVRKADLAGSVSVLDNKSFKNQPLTRVDEALQGRVAGVQVENSGVPGGAMKIRVRGANSINKSNDPLYVIDGMVRESGLEGINPEDIRSMQVLKDASSTAIYGARGSNGVILITTKGGQSGVKEIIADASWGISNLSKKLDILSPYDYAMALKEVKGISFTADELKAYKEGRAGIDWQDELFRTGVTQNYKVAVSNGNDKTQFYLSGNYMNQDGIIIESAHRRYQAKLNVTSQVTPWMHVTADVNASHDIRRGDGFISDKGNPVWVVLNYSPTMTMRDENGFYNNDPYNATSRNPIGDRLLNQKETMSDVLTARVDLRFNLSKGLTFTTTNGLDYQDIKGYTKTSKLVRPTNGMSNSDTYRMMLQSSNNLTYIGNWGKHNLTATGVYEATKSETRQMYLDGSNMLTESVGWWNFGMASVRDGSNGYSAWALMSLVGRVLYNYDNRYLFTGTLRADGSSRFTNKKWGYFPSIALAWNVSNEAFMKEVQAVQGLKLRASYGVVGNQAIEPYSTLGLMSERSYNYGTVSNVPGYVGLDSPTPNLTWEKTRQLDLGVEFGLFDNHLNVSLDYFYKRTLDALLEKVSPGYMGGRPYWVNNGEVSNRGVDLSISANILNSDTWNWTSTFNGTYLKNRVEKMAGGEKDFLYGSKAASGMVDEATIIKPGESIGSFWGYECTGLDDKGRYTYLDLNEDTKIDGSDRKVIGRAIPNFTFGWNNTLNYKNWELNFFFNAAFGAKRLNLVRFAMASMVGDSKFITLRDAYLKGFDKVGAAAEYPTLTGEGNQILPVSTKWLEKADYLRLENISLSYNLPRKITKLADVRFTLSCQNLFTITGYQGQDPAGSTFFGEGSQDVNAGIDMGTYPLPRTFTLGVRVNF